MKRILLTIISVLPLCAAAQSFTTLTLDKAQEKAAAEKKIILVDVNNARTMTEEKLKQEKSVLSMEGVAEFMNEHIVSIRVDMGTPAGKEFAPLLQMNMYPTYAFLMPNGDMLGVLSPYLIAKDNSLFLKKAKEFYDAAKVKWENTRKINFAQITFDQALERAKKENKLIFIDAVTENCQPCMMMEKNIFTLDKVADFYNSNFINLSMNLGTVHTDLAKRYNTFAYPTFLFIDGNGNLVLSESGFSNEEKFLGYGKDAISKMGIQFTSGSWSEILEIAKKENKPIFMDCYTVWCGPCKQMAANVFTNPKVAEYFNSTFINVKFDMEKGEGIELKNRYAVSAYPTFLYINKNGTVLNRLVGSMPAEAFIQKSKEGMSEQGLASMQKRYNAGERGEKFIKDYIKVLEQSYMQKDARIVVNEYLKTIDFSLLKTPEYWRLFELYTDSPDSDIFKYVFTNRDEFYALYKKDAVERKFTTVWSNGARAFIKKDGESVTLDSKGFSNYLKRMKKEGVANHEDIAINEKMNNAELLKNWKEYFSLAESKIKRAGGVESISAHELFNWGVRIDANCSDMKLRAKASQWFKTMHPIIIAKEKARKEEAAKGGFVMAMSMINYEKEFGRLAESLTKEMVKK
ncbi:MAG TPA: hypothetical protein DEO54_02260 [Rikenellaceae bacterium]|nr:MAG: hypothetical protein A2X20_10175 [Bacteroidetes bacterium GWE2_40_15]HBZ25051.1 hypothetical protein [Rikenellaceae bacterium]